MTEKRYLSLMRLGHNWGCHQMPERSFFIRGKQFPLCARCTGVFMGQIAGLSCYLVYRLPTIFVFASCGIMLLDWLIQKIGLQESTNLRRLITGLICGFALGQFYLMIFIDLLYALFR